MWVGQARVAVAGPHILDTAEVGANSGAAIGADGVERVRQRSFFAVLEVKDVTDEAVVLSVVPDNLTS